MVNINFQYDSNSGGGQNLDFVFNIKNKYFILDGATPLSDECFDLGFFTLAQEYFYEKEINIQNINGLCKIIKKKFPGHTACLCCFEFSKDTVKITNIGDIAVFITSESGNTLLRDESLSILDKYSLYRKYKYQDNSLNKIRDLRNVLYSSLGEDFVSETFINYYEINLKDITGIYGITDGLYAAVDMYNIVDSFDALITSEFETLVSKIREIENKDKDLIKFERFKVSDDATIIKMLP